MAYALICWGLRVEAAHDAWLAIKRRLRRRAA
jgi:hypothetical protein